MSPWTLLLLTMVVGLDWAHCECNFPREWHGHWYQSGLGDVEIDKNHISRKGVCHEQFRDYYLIENTDEHCHLCLLLIRRHTNILQYKQSYCIGKSSLTSICAQIRVEAVLFTLVREPAEPTPCPFQGAYHYTYSNNSGGFCRSPMSYVHQCAGQSKFSFSFRQCRNIAYTYDNEMALTCLATWKDGSQLYMYGGFGGNGITSRETSYRCFMYEILGTVIYMAMSADATCRGLRSQKDGPLVLELTQDVYRWPLPSCAFPAWLSGDFSRWRDLSGRHEYRLNSAADLLSVVYKRRPNVTSHIRTSYRCLNTWVHNISRANSMESVVVFSNTMDECESKHQCLRIVRRDRHVLEIQTGQYLDSEYSQCTDDDFQIKTKHLIYPMGMQPRPCPFVGQYSTGLDASNCKTEIRSGCGGKRSSLQVISTCHSQPIADMECVAWWDEDDRILLVTRSLIDDRDTANCFSISHNGQTSIHFAPDHQCNHAVSHIITHDSSSYTLQADLEQCQAVSTAGPVLVEGQQQQQDPGAGYTHTKPDPSQSKDHDLSALFAGNTNKAEHLQGSIIYIVVCTLQTLHYLR